YPGCFLLGGLALCLLPAVVRARRAGTWLLFGLFLTSLGVAFLFLLLCPPGAQENGKLFKWWTHTFPDWGRTLTVPWWVAVRLTDVVRYAYVPTGNALFGMVLVGAVLVWRQGQRRLLAFLTAPVALAAVAGLLCQYPFGAFRVMVFAAPAGWLLLGAGLPATFRGPSRFGGVGRGGPGRAGFFPLGPAGGVCSPPPPPPPPP